MDNGSSTPDPIQASRTDDPVAVNNSGGQQNSLDSTAETIDSDGTTRSDGTPSSTPDVGGTPNGDPIPATADDTQLTTTGDGSSATGDVAADADAAALLVLGADATHPASAGGRETTQTRARLDAARASAQADREQHAGADDQHLDTDGDRHSGDHQAGSETSRAGEDEVDAHVPELPSDQPSSDHRGDDPANHSGTDALSAIDEHFGRPADEHAAQGSSDDLGLSGRDLEKLGSGELKPTDPNMLHQQLTELGDGAAALVVVEHPSLVGDDGAPGAHAFAAINRDGEIVRVDGPPGARVETPMSDDLGGQSRAMTFDADGTVVDPLGLQPTDGHRGDDSSDHTETGNEAADGSAAEKHEATADEPADDSTTDWDDGDEPAQTAAEKTDHVRDIVTDDAGELLGTEDAKGVRLLDEERIEQIRRELTERLGQPDVKHTPKGDIEVWKISDDPKVTVTYREHSRSGGVTIDVNGVDGLSGLKRFHVEK